jgi:hypothetical protein
MKLASALKLARKHGTVEKGGQPDTYRVEVDPDNVVWFFMGHATPSAMLRHNLGEKVEETVVNVVHAWRDADGHWHEMGLPTLARALCSAKFRYHEFTHGGRTLVIEERHEGPAVRRRLRVVVDGAEVCHSHPDFAAMVGGAVEAGEVAPLLDWLEENALGRNAALVLV